MGLASARRWREGGLGADAPGCLNRNSWPCRYRVLLALPLPGALALPLPGHLPPFTRPIARAFSLIVSLATIGSLKSTILKRDPGFTTTQVHSAEVVVVAFAVIVGLISVGLWLWMARANKAGKNWARITSSVFFGLNTLGLLAIFRQAEPVLSRLITLLVWLVGLAAIIMLWRKESSEYFAAQRRP